MKINTKPEPKHVKNVPKNVSVILSICVHWSKGQILLIYPPTLSPKLLVWCFLKNVIKKKREKKKRNPHLANTKFHKYHKIPTWHLIVHVLM